jgi:hypothetical protein
MLRRVALALAASALLHGLVLIGLRSVAVLPNVGLELVIPSEAEFGVFEGEPEPPPDSAAAQGPDPHQQPLAANPTPSEPAAAPPASQAEQEPSAPKPQPKPEPKPAPPPGGELARVAPKGTQISLRLDLDRVRDTPLAPEVSALLAALPDVRMLLDGSGVEPMRDLSRLFLASPDLRREHVVMAGRYLGDEALPRGAVESLARERGQSAPWRQQRGIAIAPWLNADDTARVLALIGPGLFAITREQDLARVISVARSLAKRRNDPALTDSAGQGLVSMAEHELLAVSVENAKSFVRGPRAQQAPDKLELSVRQREPEMIEVESHAQFASAEQSEQAQRFWSELRDRYANHALVALIGLDGVLRESKLTARGQALELQARVPLSRARMLLGFLRDALGGTRPPR